MQTQKAMLTGYTRFSKDTTFIVKYIADFYCLGDDNKNYFISNILGEVSGTSSYLKRNLVFLK
jgi:hypothetical protein